MKRFITTTGSHLYGTNTPESDLDFRGVYLESLEQVMGLREARVLERKETADLVLYPLKQFVRLALQGNPNILEILFARSQYWNRTIADSDFEFFLPFIHARHAFLSQRCRATHIGYAKSQLYKIVNAKSPSPNVRSERIEKYGYDTKYAMHTIRLLMQAESILSLHDFNPSFEGHEVEALCAIRDGAFTKEAFLDYATSLINQLEALPSDLPLEPDTDHIEQLLIDTYRKYL